MLWDLAPLYILCKGLHTIFSTGNFNEFLLLYFIYLSYALCILLGHKKVISQLLIPFHLACSQNGDILTSHTFHFGN